MNKKTKMPNPTDEMVLELYLKLEEIYYSDARTIEDKVLHIRKTLEGFYKIIAGKDINSRTSLLELEKEVIIFEAVPREVIGLMKKLRIKLNPSAHFNDYEYSEEEYINLIKSIYAIIRFIAKVEFTDRSKRIFDTLVKPESVFDGLNQMQLLAVQTTDPFVFVNAGPGTGKTHLVAYRILHKLESLASDKNIIALSFTNLSAGELKSRVDDLILTSPYVDKLKQIYSGTIHAFCLDQFRLFYEEYANESFNLSVIEDEDLEDLKNILSKEKYNGLSLNQVLSEKKLLTYDGILDFYLQSLQTDKKFLAFTAENIEEIVIDEAQDLGETYYKIFATLQKENKSLSLFLVGDQRQNIYTFRGGSLDHMGILKQSNTNLFNSINLELCYRCPQTVLSYINKLQFTDCENPVLSNPRQSLDDSKRISVSEHPNKSSEAEFIINRIQELKAKNVSYNSTAILASNTFYFNELAAALNRYKLPFIVLGGKKSVVEEVRTLLLILRYLFGKSDFAILQLVQLFFEEPMSLDLNQDELLSYIDKFYNQESGEGKGTHVKQKEKYDLLHFVISKSKDSKLNFLKVLNEVFQKIKVSGILSDSAVMVCEELVEICNAENIQKYRAFNIAILSGKGKFSAFSSHQSNIQSTEFDPDKEAITISTIHSAKGLEWDYVFVPGLSHEVFPGFRKNINEERKLFYVAASRARIKLFLSRPKEVRVRQYTFTKSRSPFILNDPECLEYYK